MRLAKLSEFRRLYFTETSAPSPETLRAMIDRGEIPGGRKFGGRYFVDLDEFSRAVEAQESVAAELRELEADPLLEGLV